MQKYIQIIKSVRQIIGLYLPVTHSLIPLDIIICVMESHAKGMDLNVKSLFAEMPYSPMGIRYHYKNLLKEGWIQLISDKHDSRVKFVRPSKKLIEACKNVCTKTSKCLPLEKLKNELQFS